MKLGLGTHGGIVVAMLAAGAVRPSGAAGIQTSLDITSRYSWRGVERSDAWALQPDVRVTNIGGHGIFLRAWGSTALHDRDSQLVSEEIDLIGGITRKIRTFNATAALSLSAFPDAPNGRRRTQEVWGAIQRTLRLADLDLQPQLLAAHDFGFFDATYVRLGFFPRLDFQERLALYPGLWIGAGNFPSPSSEDEFRLQDVTFEVQVGLRPRQYKAVQLRVGPRAAYEGVTSKRWHLWLGAGVTYEAALRKKDTPPTRRTDPF